MKPEIIAIFIIDLGWKFKGHDFIKAEEQTYNGNSVIKLYSNDDKVYQYVLMKYISIIEIEEVIFS
jgi:hypothetical protein